MFKVLSEAKAYLKAKNKIITPEDIAVVDQFTKLKDRGLTRVGQELIPETRPSTAPTIRAK